MNYIQTKIKSVGFSIKRLKDELKVLELHLEELGELSSQTPQTHQDHHVSGTLCDGRKNCYDCDVFF